MTCTEDVEGVDAAGGEAPLCHCGRDCPSYVPVRTPAERRAPDGPVMGGDLVAGERVLGFTYVPPPEETPESARDDRLLTEGEGPGSLSVRHAVPAVRPSGPGDDRLPHDRLAATAVVPAARRSPCLPTAVNDLLTDGSRPARVLRRIARTLRASGHELWLSGGAPRELLAGRGREAIRDLDLTGTAPAGRFAEAARQAVEEDGETYELRPRVSPDTLVCTVFEPDRPSSLIDYRGLGLGDMPFPATGTDLTADSRQRDFTVNSLLYDFERHLVIDASGKGLRHLSGPARALVPCEPFTDPVIRAELALRAVKFLVRWADDIEVDTDELSAWTREFPHDLTDLVRRRGERTWARLQALHHDCLSDAPEDQQKAVAKTLGPAVQQLIEALLRTTGRTVEPR